MACALVAFIRMGHHAEARAGLPAYFNAQPTGKMRTETAGADYQISVVRYFGEGSEEPFFTQEGATNIEFEYWGFAPWVLGEYERKYADAALRKVPTYLVIVGLEIFAEVARRGGDKATQSEFRP
jgi:hypothetical protein